MTKIRTKHPASLHIFFATEMWERYGFYVVQTLLALYLTRHFHWNDNRIYTLVGSFTALTYVSPVIGGWIADHLLGQKRTIVVGGLILLICYLILGLIASSNMLILSLAGVAVGTGLFKPNISSLLGNEYPKDSRQRENGFTVFYMGITLGIILGCLVPSQLMNHFGWPVSFVSAAIGMSIGVGVFIFGAYRYEINDYRSYTHHSKSIITASTIIIGLWCLSFCILCYTALANFAFAGITLFVIGFFIQSVRQDDSFTARKTITIGLLCLISVIFWSFYYQVFLSFTLFLSRVAAPKIFGFSFPPPYYVSIQSIGAITFGLLLARGAKTSTAIQTGIQSANKFLYAMFFITIAFVLMTLVCHLTPGSHKLSPVYFVPVYLMIALAELFIFPVGLSAITTLSSRKRVSTMMGVFFMSLGLGGFLAGKLANLAAILPEEQGKMSLAALKADYANAFAHISWLLIISLLLGIILNLAIKYLLTTSGHSMQFSLSGKTQAHSRNL